MSEMKIWPWDRDEKPYWINPDNGYEWYIDESTTKWCTRDTLNDLPKLDAVCFMVVENKNGERTPLSRILIDNQTNKILHDDTSLEGMACKIDWLRLAKSK